MIISDIKKYTLLICFTVLLVFTITTKARAEDLIKSFKIDGNQRIETSTVISYLDLREGDPFDKALLNKALKNLYATGLFSDVLVSQKGTELVVKVVEKPIINKIIFEGNDEIKSEDLEKEISLKSRHVFTLTEVQQAVDRIKDLYRMNGMFAVSINPQMVKLEQNRVNVIFEIKEGAETLISRISFIGNEEYTDDDLSKVIRSRENSWYRFWSSDDKYDPDRMSYDQELLRKFYLENGYVDFKIEDANAELSPDSNDFFITYVLSEGERYKVGDVTITTTMPDLKVDDLKDTITLKKGDWYNINEIESTVTKMTNKLGNMQFAFVDINPSVKRDKDNKVVTIEFVVNEGQRTFIGNINVAGNTRTLDKVIRREFELNEGDPFNKDKLSNSEKNIKNLGYFSKVDVQTKMGKDPNTTDVDVTVQEQSTGSMSIGAGYSTTEGALAQFSISENNFLGKGQKLSFASTLATEDTQFDVSFTEPYFLNRDLSAGFDLEHQTKDLQDESSYSTKVKGVTLRMGYPLSEKWRQSIAYSYSNQDIYDVQSTASTYIKEQQGITTTSKVEQTVWYDTRDNTQSTTEGLFFRTNTGFAGLGGSEQFFNARVLANYYYPIKKKWIFNALGEAGFVDGWGGADIGISNRYSLGGDRLRGFDDYGVGPRDSSTSDALGGNYFYRGSVELSFPTGLPEELGFRGVLFSDFGSLWGIDKDASDVYDNSSLRASIGTGLAWSSPFGPIKINFAVPVAKEDYDKEQKFRLSFGTKM